MPRQQRFTAIKWVIVGLAFLWPELRSFAQNGKEPIPANLYQPILFPTPDFEIYLIEESTNGLVWLGTNRGIYCFDGALFRKIPHSKNGEFSPVDAGQINDLFLDEEKGQLWVASQAGASALDLKTETFTDYTFYRKEKPGDTDGACTAIFKDRQGLLWFGVMGLGLARYDTAFLLPKHLNNFGEFLTIYQIAQDVQVDSILWLAMGSGLARFNKTNGTYTFPYREPPDRNPTSLILTSIFSAKAKILLGNTWRKGCILYDIREGLFRELKVDDPKFAGVDLKFGCFRPRSATTIWGFTDEGIAIIDVAQERLSHYFPYGYPARNELKNQCVRPGHIWIASNKGLLFYDFRRYTVENHTFPQKNVRPVILTSVLEQERGRRLWAAFMYGDFIYDYDRASRMFKSISRHPKSHSDAPDYLIRLHDGRVLACGDGGIFQLKDGKLFALDWLDEPAFSKHEEFGPLFQSRDGNLWVATRFGGFYKIDPKTGRYRDCLAGKNLRSALHYFMDSQENFWLSKMGFSFYNPRTDSLLHFPYRPGERLTAHYPRGYEEDDAGNIWLSDNRVGGLMKVDPRHLEKGIVERFDAPTGSRNNLMNALKKDRRGRIWAVTEGGLQVFDPKTGSFRLFGEAAGFQLRDLLNPLISNLLPSYLTMLSSGEMLVGYKNGFAIFHPDSLTDNRELPKPYLLSVTANEQSLTAGISFGKNAPLYLHHHQNVLEFSFSSIAFYDPQKIRYRYRLLGFDKNWAESARGFLRYTHLPPGSYTFQLQALNSEGYCAKQPLEWRFRILPPWWATWWAYAAYMLFAAAAASTFYYYKKRQWQLKAQLDMEHREAERLKELDAVKTRLYTNITHEFRTPLTIILGMVKQIRDNPRDWYSEGLQMIERNGKNLLRLVNQMLDLSKLEAGAMPVHLEQGDVISFLKYNLESFHSLAEEKMLDLQFHSDYEKIEMIYDAEKLQEIVSNLVSNAIKFTPAGGQVVLRADFQKVQDFGNLILTVSDTGIGIPPEKLPHIFDRFYQADDEATRHAEGTGIGLALTKELVKLLGGKISVKSEPGKWTAFEVNLPVSGSVDLQLTKNTDRLVKDDSRSHESLPIGPSKSKDENLNLQSPTSNPILLVVEDNQDVVRYLQSFLQENYQIEVAQNGREGIEKAIETVPDIIISDVMMPEADGFELCEILKKDERTSHIPIILLTAKADVASRLAGLERGADAYLAKPFDQEEILVRLRKMVELRKKLQQRYSNAATLPAPSETNEIHVEDVFMKKVRDILEAHLGDENFGIPDLCKILNMSRAQLYRKFQALTDQPIMHYFRSLRLHRAKTLLLTTDLHVSEIAFEVGFKDHAYFTRVFTEEFGGPPTQIRK